MPRVVAGGATLNREWEAKGYESGRSEVRGNAEPLAAFPTSEEETDKQHEKEKKR
jgi:hypothetical protein